MIDSVTPIATGADPGAARLAVEAHLAELDDQRQRINTLLTVAAQTDQAAWKQHGALLASIDRLRVEIAAAARQPEKASPPLVSATAHRPGPA